MEYIDPIKRHQRVEPLYFPRYGTDDANSFSKDEQNDFESFLEDAIEDKGKLPEELEESYIQLKKLTSFDESELYLMTMNFHRYGLQLIHDICIRLPSGSFESELLEYEEEKIANALFILSVQYGVDVALHALIELWHLGESNKKLDKKIKSYLLYIAKFDFPLIPFKRQNEDLEKSSQVMINLKTFLKEKMVHHFTKKRGQEILDAFKE